MIERFGHNPGANYGKMTNDELVKLRESHIREVRSIENPGVVKKVINWGMKLGAAAATFAGSMLIADKTFLENQRLRAKLPVSEESSNLGEETDGQLFNRFYGPAPEGKKLAWPCAGCGGCPNGMDGCKPRYMNDDEKLTVDKQEGKYTFATVEDAANWARVYEKNHPAIENCDTCEMVDKNKPPLRIEYSPYAGKHLERQVMFSVVASTMLGFAALKAVERFNEKPKEKHAHHLRHEIQHIEDELQKRAEARLQNEKPQPEQIKAA